MMPAPGGDNGLVEVTMKRLLLAAGLIGTGVGTLAYAGSYGHQTYAPAHVQAVQVPLFGAGSAYQTGQPATVSVDTVEQLKLLNEKIDRLIELLGQKPLGPSVESVPAKKIDVKLAMSQACAKCHTGKASDGEFPIFEDDGVTLRTLSRVEKVAAFKAVTEDRMPKKSKLTAEGKAALLDHFKK